MSWIWLFLVRQYGGMIDLDLVVFWCQNSGE